MATGVRYESKGADMTLQEILERINTIQDQLREDNVSGALDDLNKLEDDLTVAVEQPQPMTANEEDKNADVERDADGNVKSEQTESEKLQDDLEPIADARDHHLINKNPKRIIG